jgi:hypothetical protein
MQNPDIVLVHYLNVPYPDDSKLMVTNSVSLWGEKKEWTKDELSSQLKPMCKKHLSSSPPSTNVFICLINFLLFSSIRIPQSRSLILLVPVLGQEEDNFRSTLPFHSILTNCQPHSPPHPPPPHPKLLLHIYSRSYIIGYIEARNVVAYWSKRSCTDSSHDIWWLIG